jgi:uncharacterized protein DUF6879
MSPEEFDALFDRFHNSVFRLETFAEYRVGEDDEIAAWLRGDPKPERSVRTSPWLARIARSTTVDGKNWSRAHIVELPLTDYLCYEIDAYIESQAAGEQIRIAVRDGKTALDDLREDFWLFDAGQSDRYAIAMNYAADGSLNGFDFVTDPTTLDRYETEQQIVWNAATPLNQFLSASRARET